MKLIIQVTQEDIDKGIPGDECKCALALAVKRHRWIDPITVTVTETTIEFCLEHAKDLGDKYSGVLGENCRKFVSQFDKRKELCAPNTFEVEVW